MFSRDNMEMEFALDKVLMAFGLTLLAGMATGVGALMAFLTRRTNTRFLSWALGLSAGVMVYVSFMEMIPESLEGIKSVYDGRFGELLVVLSFFGGMGLIALIDKLIPEDENPHEARMVEQLRDRKSTQGMQRTGVMVAMAIAIHNFPEGMATFVASMEGLDVALPIVVAIAIHNIPEGIAMSVPIYHATGDRRKALRLSFLSGLAEPFGALVGMLVLIPFWTPLLSSLILPAVAGIMVYISFDELLPGSERYGHHHIAMIGVILGMVVMAGSLLIF